MWLTKFKRDLLNISPASLNHCVGNIVRIGQEIGAKQLYQSEFLDFFFSVLPLFVIYK